MLNKVTIVLLVLVGLLSARVVSWTAYSTESQADADEEAIAGVAKQISSQIVSTVIVRQSEDQSDLKKSIDTKKSVHSDIFLKGIKIQRLPKSDNKFGSTASIDLDELTSKYRFKLQSIQAEVSKLEASARKALAERRYAEVARNLGNVPGLSNSYNVVLEEMSTYVPLDNSMRLNTESSTITDAMVNDLRHVVIKAAVAGESGSQDTLMSFSVDVSNAGTVVDGFPVSIAKNGKILTEVYTDSKGHAEIQIPKSKLRAAPHELFVAPRLSSLYCSAAALNPISVRYPMEVSKCGVKLSCSDAPVCATIMKKLTDRYGDVYGSEAAPLTKVITQAQLKNKMGNVQSYGVTMSLIKDGISCQRMQTGAGRNEAEAIQSAIKKMDVESCFETLELCPVGL